MSKFKHRSDEPELMDDLHFDDPVIFQTLREIDTINQYLGGNRITIDALQKVLKRVPPDQSLVIGDLGCGSGETLRRLALFVNQRNNKTSLVGIDANPHIIQYALRATPKEAPIVYKTINIMEPEFNTYSFDIVTGVLFFHHFPSQRLVDLLKSLRERTRYAIIINDLHRHWLAYYSIKWITSVFSKSYMVQYDARLSVLRAFTRKELDSIVRAAGFSSYSIEWKWAFRYQLILWC